MAMFGFFTKDHSMEVKGAVYYEPGTTLSSLRGQKVPGGLDPAVALEATRMSNFCYLEKSGCYWKSNKRDKVENFAAIKPEHLSVGLMSQMGQFADVRKPGMNLKLISSEYDLEFAEGKGTMYSGIIKNMANDTDLVVTHSEEDKVISISWRGTESFGDIKSDLAAWSAQWPYAPAGTKLYVSSGFKTAHESVIEPLTSALKGLWATGNYNRLIVTGHSLGGALAHVNAHALSYIMAEELEKSDLPAEDRLMVYTIGAPKAGNPDFLKDYTSRVPHTYRIVNDSDVVPRLPVPRRQHVGIPVLMDEERFVLNPTTDDKRQFSMDSFGSESIADHMPPLYLKIMLAHYVRFRMTDEEDLAVTRAWDALVGAEQRVRTVLVVSDGAADGEGGRKRVVTPQSFRQPVTHKMNLELAEAFGPERATTEALELLLLFCRKCLEVNVFRPWEFEFDDDALDLCSFRIGVWLLIANPDEEERKGALRLAKLREVYDLVDLDRNGLISADEYVTAVAKVYPEKQADIDEKGPQQFLHDTWQEIYESYGLDYPDDLAPDELSFTEFELWAQKRTVDTEKLKAKLHDI